MPRALHRSPFLVGGLVAAAAVAVWLGLGVRSVPPDGVALVDSPLRGSLAVPPGLAWHLPGVESFVPLDPWRFDGEVDVVTREGTRLPLRVAVELRPSLDGVRTLLAAAEGGGLEAGLERTVAGALATASGGVPDLEEGGRASIVAALDGLGTLVGEPEIAWRDDAPALLALREAEARREIAARSRDTGARILLVGLDGADWQLAEPLIAEGRLPHLAALREAGAWGNVRALTPILSPLLWTSVATGVTADRHGIVDFLAIDPDSGTKVPVNSAFRRVRAVWNQLSDAGRSVDVVAWWATWPAEPVNGHLISDRVAYSLFDFELPDGAAGATHPAAYLAEEAPELVDAADVTHEEVARFVDVTPAELAAARQAAAARGTAFRDPVVHLTKIIAATRTYHAIALDLIRRGQADLTMVYYQGIDEVCHRFMHYMEPRMPGVPAEDVARFKDVIPRFYEWQDELLGELLDAVADDTTTIVTADHGFINGPDRLRGETADIEGEPGRWHRPYGLFVMHGPPIAATRLDTTSLLDIHPTLLYLSGLPVPADGDGRVLLEALRPAFRDEFEVATIPTYEVTPFAVSSEADAGLVAKADAEMLEVLKSLGYVGEVEAPAPTDAVRVATPEGRASGDTVTAHGNLASVLLERGDLEGAEREALAALAAAPEFEPARRILFAVRVDQERHDEAIRIGEDLLRDEGASLDGVFLSRLAEAYRAAGRADEGIRRFRAGLSGGEGHLAVPLARLLLETGELDEAGRVAGDVVRADPMNVGALAVVMRVAGATGDYGGAEPALLAALERNPRSVPHLNWLAVVRESRGDVAGANELLRRALAADPDNGDAMANLGAFLVRQGRPGEALPHLERALRVSPGNLEARVNLGSAYATLGRMDDAIGQFERAVEDGSRDTSVYNALARAHGRSGRMDLAAQWLRRSLEIDPDQAEIRSVLTQLDAGT